MKFGLSFLPDADPNTKSAAIYFDDIIKLSIIADQAGLHTIKMTEHYLHPYGGYCPDPLTFLASIASVTNKIRLMTGCVLPVFHHPIQLASKACMVDAISHGRLDMGFARAYLPYEFEALNIDINESRDRYTESIDIIKKLWIEYNVSIESPFFSFSKATILPRPYQSPHPPIWGAAVMSRQSFAWLGEQGYNLLITPPPGPIDTLIERIEIYRECFSLNHQNRKPEIAISLPILMDEDHESAIAKSNHYLAQYLKVWIAATSHWNGKQSEAYPGYAKIPDILRQLSPLDMRNMSQALVGTPEFVSKQITLIQKSLSIDHFLCQIDFGAQPYEVSLKTLELLIHHVIPNLRSAQNEPG